METQEIINSIKENLGSKESKFKPIKKNNADLTKLKTKREQREDLMQIESKYIKTTEKYRSLINKSEDTKEIAILGIECIYELTQDKLFRKQNLRKME